MRGKALLAILAINIMALALMTAEIIWPESIDSAIYETVQFIRSSREGGLVDLSVFFGRWLISWWFHAAILALLISWLVTLVLAASDSALSFSGRLVWALAIFFSWFPGVILYCIVSLLRPNNSFKPTPHRGVGHGHTLR
jgi:hypothetical protein